MFGEFLGFIGTLIAGGAVAAEDTRRSNESRENRSEAKEKNSPIYWDGNNKRRSTATNEQVTVTYHNGYAKYTGLKTGTVYKNGLDDLNKQFAGSRFIYKEFPTGIGSITKRHLFDTKKNMPVKIKSLSINIYSNDFREKVEVTYLRYEGTTFCYAESLILTEDDPDFAEFKKYVGK